MNNCFFTVLDVSEFTFEEKNASQITARFSRKSLNFGTRFFYQKQNITCKNPSHMHTSMVRGWLETGFRLWKTRQKETRSIYHTNIRIFFWFEPFSTKRSVTNLIKRLHFRDKFRHEFPLGLSILKCALNQSTRVNYVTWPEVSHTMFLLPMVLQIAGICVRKIPRVFV